MQKPFLARYERYVRVDFAHSSDGLAGECRVFVVGLENDFSALRPQMSSFDVAFAQSADLWDGDRKSVDDDVRLAEAFAETVQPLSGDT